LTGIAHGGLEPFDRGARAGADLTVDRAGVVAEIVQRGLRLAALLRGRNARPHDARGGGARALALVLACRVADDAADQRAADELARIRLGPLGRCQRQAPPRRSRLSVVSNHCALQMC
jgi:hypothetical protein